MAHFAEIDEIYNVTRVVVVSNETITREDGTEDENLGNLFLTKLLGGKWIQTSYNGKMRGRYAGVGYHYDPVVNEFVPPEWKFENGKWIPPAPVEGETDP